MFEKIYKIMKSLTAILLACVVLTITLDIISVTGGIMFEMLMPTFGISFSITLIMYALRNFIGKKCPHKQ